MISNDIFHGFPSLEKVFSTDKHGNLFQFRRDKRDLRVKRAKTRFVSDVFDLEEEGLNVMSRAHNHQVIRSEA